MPGEGPGGTRTWIWLTGLTAEVSRTTPDTPCASRSRARSRSAGFPLPARRDPDQENPCQLQRGSGPVRGCAELDPGQLVGPGLVRPLWGSVRVVRLGGLLVCSDGDGDAEGLQALEVGADLLVPAGAAAVEVRAEPVGRGAYTPGRQFGGGGSRLLVPRPCARRW